MSGPGVMLARMTRDGWRWFWAWVALSVVQLELVAATGSWLSLLGLLPCVRAGWLLACSPANPLGLALERRRSGEPWLRAAWAAYLTEPA